MANSNFLFTNKIKVFFGQIINSVIVNLTFLTIKQLNITWQKHISFLTEETKFFYKTIDYKKSVNSIFHNDYFPSKNFS